MIERWRVADEEGISLVEMLVALMLLGVIMAAMAQSLTTSLFSVQRQEKQVHATALAAEFAEATVSLPWASVALCESAGTSHFGGSSYDYSATEVEPLVLLDDDHALCDPGPGPVLPTQAITRASTVYQVETLVTWHDDVQDNTAVAGSDANSTQDLKRIRVTVTWDVRGDTNTNVTETFIAPEGGEVGLRARVEHVGGKGYTYIDDATHLTESEVYLRLISIGPLSAARVEWTVLAEDGSLTSTSQGMGNPSGDRVSWQYKIEEGDPNFEFNKVPNAEIVFTFVATDPSGVETTVIDRGLFLIEVTGYRITTVDVSSPVRTTTGGSTCPFTVTADVRGALSSDPVTVEWSTQPGVLFTLPSSSSTSSGAIFSETFSGAMGFQAGETVSYTVRSHRPADDQSSTVNGSFTVTEETVSC